MHLLMAIFATWRITELIVADEIFKPVRTRWPHYFWTCSRCVSVWAGAFATLLFYFLPYANWPFAFSSIYLTATLLVAKFKDEEKQRISIYPEEQRVNWGKFHIQFGLSILKQVVAEWETRLAQSQEPTIKRTNGGR
jgi:uncharacterized membrane protein